MPNERHYSNELNLESVGINLPYNMQAEQSVLGAVLLKPETLTDLVEIIRPEMFYTRQNAQIYSEMLRLFTADQTIDFVTLLDAVISDGVFPSADEAKVYLTGLAETVPSISNVKAYAQIVQEKYLVRQLMGVAKDILQDAGDEPDADLLLENAEQRIYEIRSGRDSSALTPLSSSMVETLTNLQKISGPDADKYKGIPTGFRLLDTVLTGLGRGDLIILAARPGMGKTSFALNIATRVAMQQKVPVAIFSLEMTKEQLTNRILSAEAGIDSQAFRTGAPNLDIQFICKEIGLSRTSLYTKLKALTGIGANDYINKFRIEKALTLIANTEMTFTEISEEVGFTSPSYFSTAFKQYTGETPTQYKEKTSKI